MGFSLCTAFWVKLFKCEQLSEALLVTTVISSGDDNRSDPAMSRANLQVIVVTLRHKLVGSKSCVL